MKIEIGHELANLIAFLAMLLFLFSLVLCVGFAAWKASKDMDSDA